MFCQNCNFGPHVSNCIIFVPSFKKIDQSLILTFQFDNVTINSSITSTCIILIDIILTLYALSQLNLTSIL